jgi:bacteriocin resistance YdeI/OmpD-like protein/uncharacterized protein DUF1905
MRVNSVVTQSFKATIVESGARAYVEIPFDPDEVWDVKERHYVSGSIDGFKIRGCLDSEGTQLVLPLGPAWRRDNPVAVGAEVEVFLGPDGHQSGTVAPDIAAALAEEPEARLFFESVAPFYRNNYIRWIEDARRPETRRARISEMITLLKAGQKRR